MADDDEKIADFSNSSFTIPKKKTATAPLTEQVTDGSREAKDLIQILRQNYLSQPESQQHFTYRNLIIVNNSVLQHNFETRRKELKEKNSPSEISYGFLQVYDQRDVDEITLKGLKVGHVTQGTLGKPSMGVYLSRHTDIVSPAALIDKCTGKMIVFRVLKGKVKSVSNQSNPLEPIPNFDCFVGKQTVSDFNTASRYDLYESMMMYLYEYGDENVVDYPRSVCPVGVVQFQYHEKSPDRSNNAPGLNTIANNPQPLRSDKSIWKGGLRVGHRLALTNIDLVTNFSKQKPYSLGRHLHLRCFTTFDRILAWAPIKELLSSQLHGWLAKKREVQIVTGHQYVTWTRLECSQPNSTAGTFLTDLHEKMLQNKLVGLSALRMGGTNCVVLPTSELSSKLGIPISGGQPSLHCLFVSYRSVHSGLSAMRDLFDVTSDASMHPTTAVIRPNRVRELFARQIAPPPPSLAQPSPMVMGSPCFNLAAPPPPHGMAIPPPVAAVTASPTSSSHAGIPWMPVSNTLPSPVVPLPQVDIDAQLGIPSGDPRIKGGDSRLETPMDLEDASERSELESVATEYSYINQDSEISLTDSGLEKLKFIQQLKFNPGPVSDHSFDSRTIPDAPSSPISQSPQQELSSFSTTIREPRAPKLGSSYVQGGEEYRPPKIVPSENIRDRPVETFGLPPSSGEVITIEDEPDPRKRRASSDQGGKQSAAPSRSGSWLAPPSAKRSAPGLDTPHHDIDERVFDPSRNHHILDAYVQDIQEKLKMLQEEVTSSTVRSQQRDQPSTSTAGVSKKWKLSFIEREAMENEEIQENTVTSTSDHQPRKKVNPNYNLQSSATKHATTGFESKDNTSARRVAHRNEPIEPFDATTYAIMLKSMKQKVYKWLDNQDFDGHQQELGPEEYDFSFLEEMGNDPLIHGDAEEVPDSAQELKQMLMVREIRRENDHIALELLRQRRSESYISSVAVVNRKSAPRQLLDDMTTEDHAISKGGSPPCFDDEDPPQLPANDVFDRESVNEPTEDHQYFEPERRPPVPRFYSSRISIKRKSQPYTGNRSHHPPSPEYRASWMPCLRTPQINDIEERFINDDYDVGLHKSITSKHLRPPKAKKSRLEKHRPSKALDRASSPSSHFQQSTIGVVKSPTLPATPELWDVASAKTCDTRSRVGCIDETMQEDPYENLEDLEPDADGLWEEVIPIPKQSNNDSDDERLCRAAIYDSDLESVASDVLDSEHDNRSHVAHSLDMSAIRWQRKYDRREVIAKETERQKERQKRQVELRELQDELNSGGLFSLFNCERLMEAVLNETLGTKNNFESQHGLKQMDVGVADTVVYDFAGSDYRSQHAAFKPVAPLEEVEELVDFDDIIYPEITKPITPCGSLDSFTTPSYEASSVSDDERLVIVDDVQTNDAGGGGVDVGSDQTVLQSETEETIWTEAVYVLHDIVSFIEQQEGYGCFNAADDDQRPLDVSIPIVRAVPVSDHDSTSPLHEEVRDDSLSLDGYHADYELDLDELAASDKGNDDNSKLDDASGRISGVSQVLSSQDIIDAFENDMQLKRAHSVRSILVSLCFDIPLWPSDLVMGALRNVYFHATPSVNQVHTIIDSFCKIWEQRFRKGCCDAITLAKQTPVVDWIACSFVLWYREGLERICHGDTRMVCRLGPTYPLSPMSLGRICAILDDGVQCLSDMMDEMVGVIELDEDHHADDVNEACAAVAEIENGFQWPRPPECIFVMQAVKEPPSDPIDEPKENTVSVMYSASTHSHSIVSSGHYALTDSSCERRVVPIDSEEVIMPISAIDVGEPEPEKKYVPSAVAVLLEVVNECFDDFCNDITTATDSVLDGTSWFFGENDDDDRSVAVTIPSLVEKDHYCREIDCTVESLIVSFQTSAHDDVIVQSSSERTMKEVDDNALDTDAHVDTVTGAYCSVFQDEMGAQLTSGSQVKTRNFADPKEQDIRLESIDALTRLSGDVYRTLHEDATQIDECLAFEEVDKLVDSRWNRFLGLSNGIFNDPELGIGIDQECSSIASLDDFDTDKAFVGQIEGSRDQVQIEVQQLTGDLLNSVEDRVNELLIETSLVANTAWRSNQHLEDSTAIMKRLSHAFTEDIKLEPVASCVEMRSNLESFEYPVMIFPPSTYDPVPTMSHAHFRDVEDVLEDAVLLVELLHVGIQDPPVASSPSNPSPVPSPSYSSDTESDDHVVVESSALPPPSADSVLDNAFNDYISSVNFVSDIGHLSSTSSFPPTSAAHVDQIGMLRGMLQSTSENTLQNLTFVPAPLPEHDDVKLDKVVLIILNEHLDKQLIEDNQNQYESDRTISDLMDIMLNLIEFKQSHQLFNQKVEHNEKERLLMTSSRWPDVVGVCNSNIFARSTSTIVSRVETDTDYRTNRPGPSNDPKNKKPSLSANSLGNGILIPDDMLFKRADPDLIQKILETFAQWEASGIATWKVKLHSQVVLQLAEHKRNLQPNSPAHTRVTRLLVILTKYRKEGVVELLQKHECDGSSKSTIEYLPCAVGLKRQSGPNVFFHVMLSNMYSNSESGVKFAAEDVMVLNVPQFIAIFITGNGF